MVVALLFGSLASACTLPDDVHTIGRGSQPDHFGVEAHRDIQLVVAREKQQGIPLAAEFIVLLGGVDRVDLALHGWATPSKG